jgi:hypothetical protein
MSSRLIEASTNALSPIPAARCFQRLTTLPRSQLTATRQIPAAQRRLLTEHFVTTFRWRSIRPLLPLRLVIPPHLPAWQPRRCRSHYVWLPPDDVPSLDDLKG